MQNKKGVVLNAFRAPPLKFNFANGTEDIPTELFPIPFMMLSTVITFRLLNAP